MFDAVVLHAVAGDAHVEECYHRFRNSAGCSLLHRENDSCWHGATLTLQSTRCRSGVAAG